MNEFLDIFADALKNALLITGLVMIMMMMIESVNIKSGGRFFARISRSRAGNVLLGAIMGSIPGCLGGFATVSLYTHKILSFGALIAMMIASSGDEAFVMLATIPSTALWMMPGLFVLAFVCGMVVDLLHRKSGKDDKLCESMDTLHKEDMPAHKHEKGEVHRHFSWKRILMLLGTIAFIAAIAGGMLEHEHEHGVEHMHELEHGINLLDEQWMNVVFAVLSLVIVWVLLRAEDHFVDEHLWHHVILKHLPTVFGWTFGVLLVMGAALHFLDIEAWISSNTALMILLAALVGMIPESGPHLIFVTLYASGVVPLSVLLASCISQDGHAALPLLAESKSAFFKAKAINAAIALMVGFVTMIFNNYIL